MAITRMKKEDRIQQIKDVTLSLISKKAISAIRTAEIARMANVSEATLFKYFNNKEEIFESIIEQFINFEHPNVDYEDITTPQKFREYLNTYMSSLINIDNNRIAFLHLLLQISMDKHPLAIVKYNQTVNGFWNIMENRIEYGKLHWNFNKNFNTKIQVRLFLLSVLMFLIEQEVFDAKLQDPFSLEKVKDTAIDNLFKLLIIK
ncbi:MAG: TetR/AcrR family transcriptional regulator [Candidatus Marinimicrobia bacterium]|nr:TetR/AcrR family transcriptional regulator [Candidatus Neomarinimicrobiota bacterium]